MPNQFITGFAGRSSHQLVDPKWLGPQWLSPPQDKLSQLETLIFSPKSISCYGILYGQISPNSTRVLIGKKGYWGYDEKQGANTLYKILNNANDWVYPGGSVSADPTTGALTNDHWRNHPLEQQVYLIVKKELQEELDIILPDLTNMLQTKVFVFHQEKGQPIPTCVTRDPTNDKFYTSNNLVLNTQQYFGAVYININNIPININNIENDINTLLTASTNYLDGRLQALRFNISPIESPSLRPPGTVSSLEEIKVQFISPGPGLNTALALMPNNQAQGWFHAITKDFIRREALPPGHADRLP